MLSLYNPVTGGTVASQGGDLLLTNILIELRVLNALLVDQASGSANQSLDQYRNDVVNATANPVI